MSEHGINKDSPTDCIKEKQDQTNNSELSNAKSGFVAELLKCIDGVDAVSQIFAEQMRNVREAQQRFQECLAGYAELSAKLAPFFKRLMEGVDSFPNMMQDATYTICKSGWFFDMEMPLTEMLDLKHALGAGDVTSAEIALSEYYRKNSAIIKDRIVKTFPDRAPIIEAAFSAHDRGEYALSIPVLIAQSDGICHALWKLQLCEIRNKDKDKQQAVKELVSSNSEDAVWPALFYPLTQVLPISIGKKQRGPDFVGLNRHLVMHGESVDYPTEINSLKAISLLNYVAVVLRRD